MNISYKDMPVVLRRRLKALEETPGYCVFIKIHNPAGPGGEGLVERENTFQNIMYLLAPVSRLFKHPDGAYIFIIPEESLINVGSGRYTPLSFFDDLQMIVRGRGEYLPAKAVVVFSTNVSIVLEQEGCQIIIQEDGIEEDGIEEDGIEEDGIEEDGIDLADCLINIVDNVENGQIVMNRAFYDQVSREYESIGNRQQFNCVEGIFPYGAEIEGYERPVPMYMFPRDANV
ncbi:MAG TPA: hypothetical protein PLV91_03885 [Verrucomicrobiota bacterium]|nr:hypothetical protein [Verrucomicrobiota bacterium]